MKRNQKKPPETGVTHLHFSPTKQGGQHSFNDEKVNVGDDVSFDLGNGHRFTATKVFEYDVEFKPLKEDQSQS